eukprot:3234049-Amphidinium_carterae.1
MQANKLQASSLPRRSSPCIQVDQIREGRAIFLEGDTATLQRLAPAVRCLLAPGALLELTLNVSQEAPGGKIVPEAGATRQFVSLLQDSSKGDVVLADDDTKSAGLHLD